MPFFWYFLIYSLLGYGLEKVFAKATHAKKQNRKGFLLLPLCPVYGLGMAAVLSLPEELIRSPYHLFFWGTLTATAVEYAVHWFYDTVFGVCFWDYSGTFGTIRGRVCVPFSLIWGVLTTVAVVFLQPFIQIVAFRIPDWATYGALLLLTADLVFSARLLSLYHDTEMLNVHRLYSVSRQL
ncbi:putative ABC transporter permease [Oscillibacter sp. MSJ-2]|uniref:ABC transporter permease n=1 Tax=Dysosmobacter acutus TaxID=2841504 RepID=A0ABS6F7P3_9FIRM|nr:putative ABC transporter permease [Dysosmobacter acutus]MBU5626301.1 putative ABC transporter permease [Dysosmobacter acutus]